MVRVSVIIPMRNEAASIGRCLDSVLAQVTDDGGTEVLCVDGASTDGTADIVRRYAARHASLRLLENPAKIVPAAMNLGLREARGEVIIRLDSHAEYAPDYLASCLEVLDRTGADVVGGYMATLPAQDTPTGRAIAAATSSRFGVGGSAFRTGGTEREGDTVPFGCFRRDVFTRFGIYDERLVRNQDIELCRRIRRGGGRIVLSPQIRLTYFNRSTFGGLRQQAFHNGLWNAYTTYLVGLILSVRHFVPLIFVLSLLALALLSAVWWPFGVLLGLDLLAYLAAAAAAALAVGMRRHVSAARLFLAFFQLHLVYGFGWLWGLGTAPFRFGLRPARHSGEALPPRRA